MTGETEELGEPGTLLVEDVYFAVVPEWVIHAELSDAAFRLYCLLLRFGNGSGQRMPSRRLLAIRLHRSMDSVDRALRELESARVVVVERRRRDGANLTNRYHVRTSPPAKTDAAARPEDEPDGGPSPAARRVSSGGSRKFAATRNSAARVAADLRPNPEKLTQRRPPPPTPSDADGAKRGDQPSAGALKNGVVTDCGIDDFDAFTAECERRRLAVGASTTRWSAECLLAAIQLAVKRGWPPAQVRTAMLSVAADPATRSPMRLAEAGPWWDIPSLDQTASADAESVLIAEELLDDHAGQRPRWQAIARRQLTSEGVPLSRSVVVVRAAELLRDYLADADAAGARSAPRAADQR